MKVEDFMQSNVVSLDAAREAKKAEGYGGLPKAEQVPLGDLTVADLIQPAEGSPNYLKEAVNKTEEEFLNSLPKTEDGLVEVPHEMIRQALEGQVLAIMALKMRHPEITDAELDTVLDALDIAAEGFFSGNTARLMQGVAGSQVSFKALVAKYGE